MIGVLCSAETPKIGRIPRDGLHSFMAIRSEAWLGDRMIKLAQYSIFKWTEWCPKNPIQIQLTGRITTGGAHGTFDAPRGT